MVIILVILKQFADGNEPSSAIIEIRTLLPIVSSLITTLCE